MGRHRYPRPRPPGRCCPESHPWLTRVKIPTKGIDPYDIQRYRLMMPAHEVEVDDTVVQVKRARLNILCA